ncbi:hypothetical protein FACS1894199_05760 [Bacteroidia bacterium]|nr:hypothetical protein FACS1894199_05760 [Bacteroidia bacterium]
MSHEQNRTEQNRTEQNRTEQNRTEQNRTEQNRTEQNRTPTLIDSIYKKLCLYYQKIRGRLIPLYKKSYSQNGEDVIIKFLMDGMHLPHWTWIDIGAHHPRRLSNTAMFYKKGGHGINVEADTNLIKSFYKERRRDINLNVAIADKSGIMDFYKMSAPWLNTLSEQEAHECEAMGHKIVKIIPIPTMTITEIIDKYCHGDFPEVLTLDAEGYDLKILKTIRWDISCPILICVETSHYTRELKNQFQSMQKSEISEYLLSKGYSIVASTLVNTIFILDKMLKSD